MKAQTYKDQVLVDGELQIDRPFTYHHGWSIGGLLQDTGQRIRVLFRPIEDGSKFKKAAIANEANRLFGFSTLRLRCARHTITTTDGSVEGWLQEAPDESIYMSARRLARRWYILPYGGATETDLVRLLDDHPGLQSRVMEAVVERLVFGDPACQIHDGNILLIGSDTAATDNDLKVANIDLKEAFSLSTTPNLRRYHWISKYFSGRELESGVLSVLENIETMSTSLGCAELASRLFLSIEQAQALCCRNRNLLYSARLPIAC